MSRTVFSLLPPRKRTNLGIYRHLVFRLSYLGKVFFHSVARLNLIALKAVFHEAVCDDYLEFFAK
jgi:hypothetical protein